MRAAAAEHLPAFQTVVFSEVAEFYGWAQSHLSEVALISLDHDLDLILQPDGTYRDPGDGRQAAAWLAEQRPACPVIIHTTNAPAAESMRATLQDAGWTVGRVIPGPDVSWICTDWLPAVRAAIDTATGVNASSSAREANSQLRSPGTGNVPLGRALADVAALLFSLYLLLQTVIAWKRGGERWDMLIPWCLGFFGLLPMAGLWIATLAWDPHTAPDQRARRWLVRAIVAAILMDVASLALAFTMR